MKHIAVIGAGAMGSGIAQVAASHGCEVILYDSSAAAIVKARDNISASLNKLVEKTKLTDQEAKAIFGRMYFVDHLESIGNCELIIEAILEDETAKRNLFEKISALVMPETVLATNTSSLSVTGLAKTVALPENFIGIHFFNPPVLMKLVEIIPALQTSSPVVEKVTSLIRSWGKVPVQAKDTPGFIVNRIARPYYSEALRIAEENLATPAEIDASMKRIGGFKMGPFELMDFIGHDVNYAVTHSVWSSMYHDPRYKPSHLQASLVKAGWLGRKTGKGFFSYAGTDAPPGQQPTGTHPFIFERIITMLIHEAADALYYGVATKEDIDLAMTLGVNYPKGLLQWADEIGIAECVSRMDKWHDQYHEDRYRGSYLLRKMAETRQTFYP
jgi:3-hydroxybutyryl-CoA dehydrogenase